MKEEEKVEVVVVVVAVGGCCEEERCCRIWIAAGGKELWSYQRKNVFVARGALKGGKEGKELMVLRKKCEYKKEIESM